MSRLNWVSIVACGVLLSTAAVAFQEQPAGSSAPAAQQGAQSDPKAPELAGSTEALKPSLGTDVRIPGFGKLGSLPKMDFGLELLYGATDGKPPEAPSHDENREDLTIRGTVKHKF